MRVLAALRCAFLTTTLPYRRGVEETQSFGGGIITVIASRRKADRLAGGAPLDLVSGLDPELIGERFWNRHLQLAGDLRHFLTLSRINSLLISSTRTKGGDRVKRIASIAFGWLVAITAAHLSLNVDWNVVRERRLPIEKRKLNVAYIPVT
jgi:hypothetical protein